MLDKFRKYSELIKKYPSHLLISGLLMLTPLGAQALTADDVLNKMDSDERFSYIAGIVGGLAYSRFLRDKPDKSGMACIYNWYYDSKDSKWGTIKPWFSRHLEKPAEPLLYVLIKKECGA